MRITLCRLYLVAAVAWCMVSAETTAASNALQQCDGRSDELPARKGKSLVQVPSRKPPHSNRLKALLMDVAGAQEPEEEEGGEGQPPGEGPPPPIGEGGEAVNEGPGEPGEGGEGEGVVEEGGEAPPEGGGGEAPLEGAGGGEPAGEEGEGAGEGEVEGEGAEGEGETEGEGAEDSAGEGEEASPEGEAEGGEVEEGGETPPEGEGGEASPEPEGEGGENSPGEEAPAEGGEAPEEGEGSTERDVLDAGREAEGGEVVPGGEEVIRPVEGGDAGEGEVGGEPEGGEVEPPEEGGGEPNGPPPENEEAGDEGTAEGEEGEEGGSPEDQPGENEGEEPKKEGEAEEGAEGEEGEAGEGEGSEGEGEPAAEKKEGEEGEEATEEGGKEGEGEKPEGEEGEAEEEEGEEKEGEGGEKEENMKEGEEKEGMKGSESEGGKEGEEGAEEGEEAGEEGKEEGKKEGKEAEGGEGEREEKTVERHGELSPGMEDRRKATVPFDAPEDIALRPHVGSEPDVVQFGVLCKQLYSIDFPNKKFTGDFILNYEWSDPRAAMLVPEGLSAITLPGEDARFKLWMPDVTITNGDQEDSSVMVKVDYRGRVSKVVRTEAVMRSDFDSSTFPFDQQTLRLRLASSTNMMEDVVLSPMNDETRVGVEDDAFRTSDYSPTVVKMRVVSEVDGPLRKSRGEFDIDVKRSPWNVIRNTIAPAILITSTAWVSFYVPGSVAAFFMPRVVMTTVAFIALVALALAVERMQPINRNATSWLSIFMEMCLGIVYATLTQNIVVQYIRFEAKMDSLADRLDREMQIIFPCLGILSWVIAFTLTQGDWYLILLGIIRILLWATLALYIVMCIVRMFLKRDSY